MVSTQMSIKNLIYDTVNGDNKQYIPKNHNPSSASFKFSTGRVIGKDLLSLYYKWTGVIPSNPANAQAILRMRLGDGVHLIIAQILKNANVKALPEVGGKINVEGLKFPISYRVDSLVELNGQLEVLEVKSTDEDAILGKGWGIHDKGPKEDHLLQCISYYNIVPGVKQVRLLYVARDSGVMEEFLLERKNNFDEYRATQLFTGQIFDLEITWKGIVQRWSMLESALETKTIPLPEFKVWLNDENEYMKVKQIKGERYRSDWEALYSPYADMIYKDPKNFEVATFNAEFKRKGLIK